MDNYLSRLASFFSFPFTSPVSTKSLAESGFHYTGHKDEVVCHRCNLRYSGWQKHDDPMVIHTTVSPNCTFVLNTDGKMCYSNHCERIPLASETVSMSNQQRKIKSLTVRDTTGGILNRAKESIKQGQSVSGQQDVDSLSHEIQKTGHGFPNAVNQGHSPASDIETHYDIDSHTSQGLNAVRPRYPQFAMLAIRLASYQNWPTHLRQRPEELAKAGLFYEGSSDCVRCFHCGGGLRKWDPEDDPLVEHARWSPFCEFMRLIKGDRFIMDVQAGTIKAGYQTQSEKREAPKEKVSYDDPAVLSVMEMGYTREGIAKVIEVLTKRKAALTARNIMEYLLDIEEEAEQKKEEEEKKMRAIEEEVEQKKKEDEKKRRDSDMDDLRMRTICKVCLDNEIQKVFLPCGHLCACADCSEKLKKCPVCRQPIDQKVNAYLT